MLYNARSANQLSRFVSEIPPRLIQEGAARTQTRVPRPMGRPTVENPAAPRYSYASSGSAPAKVGGVSIPGLQKGFGAARPAAPSQGLHLFKTGDQVIHAVFGKGTVQEVEGEGSNQKVIVRFSATDQLKRFSANIAPLRKVDK